jgi:hypothetical protein
VYDLALEQMTLASVTTAGTQGDDDSSEPSISADGRYVVFRSAASNLVAGDQNRADDVFIRDRSSNVTARVSVLGSGVESDGVSRRPAVSADGHFIAFESAATTFGFGDGFGAVDLFLAAHDVCPGGPGIADSDSDADGTPDCHDPATSAALELLVQQTRDAVKRMKPDRPERIVLAEQLREAAGWFRAAANNAALSTKQRKLVGATAAALTDLADSSGKAMTRKRTKALGLLRKLLKASRA